MSNEKKNATLGMSHGTAAHRLRKIVLFDLLKRHSENVCFRCSELIENIDDLSLEHKQPWEGISADLFWDLNNISFSHIGCNVKSRRTENVGARYRKVLAPIGQAFCSVCKKTKADSEFHKSPDRWNGLNSECKSCKSERNALRDRRVSSIPSLTAERILGKDVV